MNWQGSNSMWRYWGLPLALLITACGGASDDFLAGIEGTGVVTGFGSIFIDGIEFATDEVDVQINGETGDAEDLRVGDLVTVTGRNSSAGEAIAERIVFDRAIGGPIESINVVNDNGEIRVLEQLVVVNANTRFIGTEVDALTPGDMVAVSGLRASSDSLRATSIEHLEDLGDTRVDVEGRVQSLTSSSFQIGGLEVMRGAAETVEDEALLANGALVEVIGTRANSGDGPLMATRIEVRGNSIDNRSGTVFIDGVITSFNSEDDFRVDNISVAAGSASRTDNSAVTSLGTGLRVSLRGEIVNGRLEAESLQIEPQPDRRVTAAVTEVLSEPPGVSLLGIDADTLSDTLYIDAREGANPALRVSNLSSGDHVQLTGYADRDGRFIVTRLTRVSESSLANVRGPVDSSSSSGELVVSGVSVVTDSDTEFLDSTGGSISRQSFFSQANEPGTTVTVSGPDNAGGITNASSAQLLSTQSEVTDP